MKRKNSGISLLISFGISFLVLGIAFSVIVSIDRAVQRSADLGRSAQVFFAAESGLEAAIFHHNARGQGVHFVGTSGPQKLSLPASSAEVDWTINGRIAPVEGILRGGQKIQIPLFWDNSINPTLDPNQDGVLSGNFVLSFFSADVPDIFPDGFNFGTTETDAVLIDWAVSREHATEGLQTFVPVLGTSEDCDASSGFICRQEFLDASDEVEISSASGVLGEILPGDGTPVSLSAFMNDPNSEQFTLSFQSLLSFLDNSDPDDIVKIEGIRFSLEGDGNPLPKSEYTVLSEVTLGAFSKTITAVVPEKTTIGAFDYVIFD